MKTDKTVQTVSHLVLKINVPRGNWQSNGFANHRALHKPMLNQGFIAIFVFLSQPVSYQILRSEN